MSPQVCSFSLQMNEQCKASVGIPSEIMSTKYRKHRGKLMDNLNVCINQRLGSLECGLTKKKFNQPWTTWHRGPKGNLHTLGTPYKYLLRMVIRFSSLGKKGAETVPLGCYCYSQIVPLRVLFRHPFFWVLLSTVKQGDNALDGVRPYVCSFVHLRSRSAWTVWPTTLIGWPWSVISGCMRMVDRLLINSRSYLIHVLRAIPLKKCP